MSERVTTKRKGTGKAVKTQVRVASDAEVAALAEDLRSYGGDSAHAQGLRQRLMDIGQIRTKSDDPAVLAIRKAATLGRGRPIDADFGIGRHDESVPESEAARLALQAPFLGLEPDKTAAYHDPLVINDASAIAWARYMATYPVVPDERMRAFLLELIGVRPRNLWIPAAEALAAFAARGDQPSKDALIELGAHFGFLTQPDPEATAASPAPDAATQRKATRTKREKHLYRHTRYALSCWVAQSEPPHTPPQLRHEIPAAELPKDDTDASIELLCLAARLRSERDQASLLPRVEAMLQQLTSASIVEEAARLLYQVLAEAEAETRGPLQADALNQVAQFLSEPQWLADGPAPSFDQLLSWLQSLRLLSARDGDIFTTHCLRYPRFRALLQFHALRPARLNATAAAVARLNHLLVPARFAAMTPLDKVLCIAELTTLFTDRDLCDQPWSALVAASHGGGARMQVGTGTVANAGLTDLITWLMRLYESADTPDTDWFPTGELTRYLPMHLLRDQAATEDVIIALARVRHPQLANQIAVQAERHLRQLHAQPPAQLRFLWRLLEVDPLAEIFAELLEDLRGGHTSLRALVQAIADLDQVRSATLSTTADQPAEMARLLPPYQSLVAAAKAHVRSVPERADDAEAVLSAALSSVTLLHDAVCLEQPANLSDLCQTMSLALRGDEHPATHRVGLAAWFDWVDQPQTARSDTSAASNLANPTLRAATLERLAAELDDAAGPLQGAPDSAWFPAVLDRMENICSQLAANLQGAPQPERIGLTQALSLIRTRLARQRQRLEQQQVVADRLAAWVESRDAARLAEWSRSLPAAPAEADPVQDLANTRPALLESIHQVLRESGHEAQEQAAEALREICAGRTHARLPPMVTLYIRQRRTEQVLKTADDPEKAGSLGTETLSQMNDYLLERLYLGRAARIRRLISSKLAPAATGRPDDKLLPRSALVHLWPLLVGMPVGTLLVLDIGDSWNDVLLPGHEVAFLITVIASLSLGLLTLVGALARQTSSDARRPGVGGRLRWVLGLFRRSVPVFLGSWLLAICCSFALVLNLADTSATAFTFGAQTNEVEWPLLRQTLLWSSLSVFLGIFLGLIAQGRGLYGRKGLDDG